MVYGFVDLSYLLELYEDAFGGVLKSSEAERPAIYSERPEIDVSKLQLRLGNQKTFIYDALQDKIETPSNPEEEEKNARLDWRESLHESLSKGFGCHVKHGHVQERRRPRRLEQKEVDVLLAVDALSHVFRGNCKHVNLLAGDSDFIPLVNALVDFGAYVALTAGKAASKLLVKAADQSSILEFDDLHNLCTEAWQSRNPKISVSRSGINYENYHTVRDVGTLDGATITQLLFSGSNLHFLWVKDQRLSVGCSDQEVAKRYMVRHLKAEIPTITE